MDVQTDKFYEKILEKIPDYIDFGFIAVKIPAFQSLIIENSFSNKPIYIEFNNDKGNGFKVEPQNLIVQKSSKAEAQFSITVDQANVTLANVMITIDKYHSKVIKICAISKFSYVRIHKNLFDFGNVMIGKKMQLDLILTNPEKVVAKFKIIKKSGDKGPYNVKYFSLSVSEGEIPPNSSYLVKITYNALFVNLFSCDNFVINVFGGNTERFSCIGNCLALNTNVSSRIINFGSIELDETNTKLIRLVNDSDLETTYQFYYNNPGPFYIAETEGIIPARSNVRVYINFKPRETIIYYDRALDIYGSCHDLLNKPKMLEQKHIEVYRYKVLTGYYTSKLSNINVSNLIESMSKSRKGFDKKALSLDEAPFESTTQTQLHKELFWETTSSTRILYCNTDLIDFRFVDNGKTSEPFMISIYNSANEKIKVKWIIEKANNTIITKSLKSVHASMKFQSQKNTQINPLANSVAVTSQHSCFIVVPEEFTINKKSFAEFKVFFRPNKTESYFYNQLVCLGSLQTNYDNINKKDDKKAFNISQSQKINMDTMSSYQSNLLKSLQSNEVPFEIFDPPIPLRISAVGYSFPPTTQISIPMADIFPSERLFFQPSSLNQSFYQSLTITNKSDTPLYYKFISDVSNVFRVHPKSGLIAPKSFNLICVEFCPSEERNYEFALNVIFNHDTKNMKRVILIGNCVHPLVKIEEGDNIYFPPSFLGINTRKSITIINMSPIRVNVQVLLQMNPKATVLVEPSYFDLEANQIRKIDLNVKFLELGDIISKVDFLVNRVYDPHGENIGVYNPGSQLLRQFEKFDKRSYQKSISIIGMGADGNLQIDPPNINFGTVKVAFQKMMTFSIYNPSICNFYVKLVFPKEDQQNISKVCQLSFTEGLINSLCKKDVTVTFTPITRANINFKIYLYATENTENNTENIKTEDGTTKKTSLTNMNKDTKSLRSLKAELNVIANGDYPLIKIVDIRNINICTTKLWEDFNVDSANEELLKKLTLEEEQFINSEKSNKTKRMKNYFDKLKIVRFDFGKQLLKKKQKGNFVEVFLTLKNVGGVTSEFFFKLSDDISIKNEIWMDPVEPNSNETHEYQVLKEKIFEIEPRKNKLEPGECCNISLKYNIKEENKFNHSLKVIFQIVNGKPLIFELYGESHNEKKGILQLRKKVLDFGAVPIGFMLPVISPIELKNIGGLKVKYKVDVKQVEQYNKENDFTVFKLEQIEGNLGPSDVKHIICHFRPLTNKDYELVLPIEYSDDINKEVRQNIVIRGTGYLPITDDSIPEFINPYESIPKFRVHNYFEDKMIQKCGVSLEEIDFGYMTEKTTVKTFILYNYSNTETFTFEFLNTGFNMKDILEVEPVKGSIEPTKHIIVKLRLSPKNLLLNYDGELEIKIIWQPLEPRPIKESDRDNLFIRIIKKSFIRDIGTSRTFEPNASTYQSNFVEEMLNDFLRDIVSNDEFDNLISERIDNQPISLYEFSNNDIYTEHAQVRQRLYENTMNKFATISQDNTNSVVDRSSINKTKTGKRHSTLHKETEKVESSNALVKLEKMIDTTTIALFDENEANKLDEKYMKDITDRYNYTPTETNEKVLFVNDEAKNLVSNIMEDTVFNIIAEAVYGEANLTESTKIYFFKNKK